MASPPRSGRTHRSEGKPSAPAAPERARAPAKAPLPRNLAAQRLLSNGVLHAKLRVGSHDDPAETEADRIAARLLSAAPCACGGGTPCAECRAREPVQGVMRKPRSRRAPAPPGDLALGPSRPLPAADRTRYETQLGVDLSGVRLHTGGDAAASAESIDAHAFTVGEHIAFGAGEYRPGTHDGRRLMAHELAHVAQGEAVEPVVRRDEKSQTCEAPKPDPFLQPGGMCRVPKPEAGGMSWMRSLKPKAALPERVEAFKALVRTTAVHRMKSNQQSLRLWYQLVEEVIPTQDIAAMGLLQTGGAWSYLDMQDIADPGLRDFKAREALGTAPCGGGKCHELSALSASARERRMFDDPNNWITPNLRRAGLSASQDWGSRLSKAVFNADGTVTWTDPEPPAPADPRVHEPQRSPYDTVYKVGAPNYHPPRDSLEGKLNAVLPPPDQLLAVMEKVKPILAALGPARYDVVGKELLGSFTTSSPDKVRAAILSAITARICDFETLVDKINSGDVSWEKFGPIIGDLLPTADQDVAAEIKDEMDSNHFWQLVETIAVGVLTVAALILTIFPPTSAIGIGALGALELGLAAYGGVKGVQMLDEGETYGLATGADDVFTQDQQRSATTLKVFGFIGVVAAPLGAISGTSRLATAFGRGAAGAKTTALALTEAGELTQATTGGLLRSGRTVERGGFIVTFTEDGRVIGTLADQPGVMMIIDGDTISLYQATGDGMRLVRSQSLATVGEAADAAGGLKMLGAGDEAAAALPSGAMDDLALGAPRQPLALGPGSRPGPIAGVGEDGAELLDAWAQPFESGFGQTNLRRIAAGEDIAGDHRVLFDIDEPLPVGARDIKVQRAYDRALDAQNRQLLDWKTNRTTKSLGIDPRDIARGRNPLQPVSLADQPNALFTRRFGEVTEMQQVFDEAVARVPNPQTMRPTALKNAINGKMREIIRDGSTPSGRVVRDALEAAGFEFVPHQGYTGMGWPEP